VDEIGGGTADVVVVVVMVVVVVVVAAHHECNWRSFFVAVMYNPAVSVALVAAFS